MQMQRHNRTTKKSWLLSLSVVGSALLATGCEGPIEPGAADHATTASPLAHVKEARPAPSGEDTVGVVTTDCPPDHAGTPSSATVDIRSNRGRLSPIAVGLNAAAWDGHLVDREIPALLRNIGVQMLRYPGGSTSDNYHWLSNAPDDPAQGRGARRMRMCMRWAAVLILPLWLAQAPARER